MFPLGSHNALGSPDSATIGSLHPTAQAEGACLGTQLTPHEAVTSLADQGKLREGDVPMATLSPAVVLDTSWPRSGHNHLPSSVPDTRVRTPGQLSSWHHFSCFCLKRKTSGHQPTLTPSPSPPQPVSFCVPTIPTSECVSNLVHPPSPQP